jgi:general secretion pathway protein M
MSGLSFEDRDSVDPGADGAAPRGLVGAWWQGLAERERRLVAFGAVAVVLALLWWVAVGPALRTVLAAPAELDAAERQLQAMQALAAEARELRSMPPVGPEQAAAALRTATERLGDDAKLVLQGDRAVLNLNNVASGELRDWLQEARSGARARPVEASLTRSANGLSGSIVVSIGGTP